MRITRITFTLVVAVFLGLLIATFVLLFLGAPLWVWIVTIVMSYLTAVGIVVMLAEIQHRKRGRYM